MMIDDVDKLQAKAVGLYAVLDRDISDFVEMITEAHHVTLDMLYKMLTLENDEHDQHTKEINKIGADLVAGVIKAIG